ncbi:hypothetical protein BJ742DRAFT_228557 [Cladochytrium replicatum]|nr:hypothetical protein BJ742DRAFT_228557 [Cladochytrium replicatum]
MNATRSENRENMEPHLQKIRPRKRLETFKQTTLTFGSIWSPAGTDDSIAVPSGSKGAGIQIETSNKESGVWSAEVITSKPTKKQGLRQTTLKFVDGFNFPTQESAPFTTSSKDIVFTLPDISVHRRVTDDCSITAAPNLPQLKRCTDPEMVGRVARLVPIYSFMRSFARDAWAEDLSFELGEFINAVFQPIHHLTLLYKTYRYLIHLVLPDEFPSGDPQELPLSLVQHAMSKLPLSLRMDRDLEQLAPSEHVEYLAGLLNEATASTKFREFVDEEMSAITKERRLRWVRNMGKKDLDERRTQVSEELKEALKKLHAMEDEAAKMFETESENEDESTADVPRHELRKRQGTERRMEMQVKTQLKKEITAIAKVVQSLKSRLAATEKERTKIEEDEAAYPEVMRNCVKRLKGEQMLGYDRLGRMYWWIDVRKGKGLLSEDESSMRARKMNDGEYGDEEDTKAQHLYISPEQTYGIVVESTSLHRFNEEHNIESFDPSLPADKIDWYYIDSVHTAVKLAKQLSDRGAAESELRRSLVEKLESVGVGQSWVSRSNPADGVISLSRDEMLARQRDIDRCFQRFGSWISSELRSCMVSKDPEVEEDARQKALDTLYRMVKEQLEKIERFGHTGIAEENEKAAVDDLSCELQNVLEESVVRNESELYFRGAQIFARYCVRCVGEKDVRVRQNIRDIANRAFQDLLAEESRSVAQVDPTENDGFTQPCRHDLQGHLDSISERFKTASQILAWSHEVMKILDPPAKSDQPAGKKVAKGRAISQERETTPMMSESDDGVPPNGAKRKSEGVDEDKGGRKGGKRQKKATKPPMAIRTRSGRLSRPVTDTSTRDQAEGEESEEGEYSAVSVDQQSRQRRLRQLRELRQLRYKEGDSEDEVDEQPVAESESESTHS